MYKFHACDGGGDNSACAGAMVSGPFGIASTGVTLGRLMVVSCWLVGWVDGIGGGR